ncbi:hypothetical protein [Guptibacillus algicola]|uniref:hypothetical protein n=1 Tax=Guptibacillus algicola TaxID=225844 RepID=UPI001CD425AB|nr:hypothetical protein [Alkalihalobacillus algicola]MCA0988394.1 hypothetical protein [Alkalihalobacillus algicola]
MKKLTKAQFEKACSYIENEARGIDRAFFKYWKGEGNEEQVLNELEKYRNEDGGFGHSLEPDFRLEESSPMATSVAFQYLTKLGLPKNHPFIKKGIEYFQDTYRVGEGWEAVPEAVNDVPHAPWWSVHPGEQKYSANPDAEIVGYLLAFSDDKEPKSEMLMKVMDHLSDLNEYEIHEVLCYLRLADLAGGDIKEVITDKVHKQLPYIVDRPEKWDSYGVQPVVLVESDESPFVDELNQELLVNLDYIVDQQNEDGSWEPTWEWGQYEKDWEQAKREWKGSLTVQQIITLSKFDRIEK